LETTFANKCKILADLWLTCRGDEEFAEFIEYNDLGLPLAYCKANGIINSLTPTAATFVNEAFSLLLSGLEIEDEGFKSLSELLQIKEEND